MKKIVYSKKAVLVLTLAAAMTSAITVSAEPFRFGVMSDTQWKANLDGKNPGSSAESVGNFWFGQISKCMI